jgi:peptide/nickel transport system ATP-binding protein
MSVDVDAVRVQTPALAVDGLRIELRTGAAPTTLVRDVSFELRRGERLALVGESGSGKTITALALIRLLRPPLEIARGSIKLGGDTELTSMSERDVASVRGRRVAMIYQDPLTALNPVQRIGNQLVEALRIHAPLSRAVARRRAIELLGQVGLSDPASRIDGFPHEFSGGMRQRVMIAMALSGDPEVLIADEPTTALDVTTQAQILDLMSRLQRDFGSAIMMITHDLGVVAEIADEVIVMYAAEVAEQGSATTIFKRPQHPYTWGLLGSLPRLNADVERLVQIKGQPPSLLNPPRGCRFHPRCPYVMNICKEQDPELLPVPNEGDHLQACHLDQETKDREAQKLLAGMMAEAG